jgi:hypothetical protein
MAADPTRYVSPTGHDNPTCDVANPCQHVVWAVSIALPGDTIRIAPGTYVEQVLVTKSLNIVGAGIDTTTIKAPQTKVFDVPYGKTYVMEFQGPQTTNMARLTVAGPSGVGGGLNCAPNPLSLDMGISVVDLATLNLGAAAVRDIYDIDNAGQKNSGCQRGTAISVGRPGGSPLPSVGHARVAGVEVTNYQKNGVAVRSPGSSLELAASRVVNLPSDVIASNGVEVLDGAHGQVTGNSVSGNECNKAKPFCGPDPLVDTLASGILIFGADATTVVAGNNVHTNDMGIYTDDGITIRDNRDSNNRSVGIYVDTDATNAHITGNTTNNDGYYGIAIGPAFPVDQGGTGKPNPGGNFFINDTAFGNHKFDLYQSPDAGPNINRDNHCATALPSRQYWDCHGADDEGDGQNGDQGDNQQGGGDRHGPAANRED